jgi:hypothetical protein
VEQCPGLDNCCPASFEYCYDADRKKGAVTSRTNHKITLDCRKNGLFLLLPLLDDSAWWRTTTSTMLAVMAHRAGRRRRCLLYRVVVAVERYY